MARETFRYELSDYNKKRPNDAWMRLEDDSSGTNHKQLMMNILITKAHKRTPNTVEPKWLKPQTPSAQRWIAEMAVEVLMEVTRLEQGAVVVFVDWAAPWWLHQACSVFLGHPVSWYEASPPQDPWPYLAHVIQVVWKHQTAEQGFTDRGDTNDLMAPDVFEVCQVVLGVFGRFAPLRDFLSFWGLDAWTCGVAVWCSWTLGKIAFHDYRSGLKLFMGPQFKFCGSDPNKKCGTGR